MSQEVYFKWKQDVSETLVPLYDSNVDNGQG